VNGYSSTSLNKCFAGRIVRGSVLNAVPTGI
jgi:hypothetical protein